MWRASSRATKVNGPAFGSMFSQKMDDHLCTQPKSDSSPFTPPVVLEFLFAGLLNRTIDNELQLDARHGAMTLTNKKACALVQY